MSDFESNFLWKKKWKRNRFSTHILVIENGSDATQWTLRISGRELLPGAGVQEKTLPAVPNHDPGGVSLRRSTPDDNERILEIGQGWGRNRR